MATSAAGAYADDDAFDADDDRYDTLVLPPDVQQAIDQVRLCVPIGYCASVSHTMKC